MGEQVTCQCGKTVYKFHSKKKDKDYFCNTNQYDDWHNCNFTLAKKTETTPQTQTSLQTPSNITQLFEDIKKDLAEIKDMINKAMSV